VLGRAQLYMWEYERFGSSPAPVVCLKTRRSLRAVHFHPHGAPLLLTAEVRAGKAPAASAWQRAWGGAITKSLQ